MSDTPTQKPIRSKTSQPIRRAVQIFFFVLIGLIVVNHTLEASGITIPFLSTASLHALCPFGGVVTLFNLATLGVFVQKIHSSSVVLLALILFLSVLAGPVICGWVCPLGSIQEWVGSIGKRLFPKRFNQFVPVKIDGRLRLLRYLVLVWIVYLTARSGSLIFNDYDPYVALFEFWTEEVTPGSLVILALTLITSLFVERPWCKYLCPMGAVLGLTNRFRLFTIHRSEHTCISCGKCDHACPMNIPVSTRSTIADTQCISCMECTSERSCPIADTVDLRRKSKVKTGVLALSLFLILFGGIAAADAAGFWSTENDKQPAKFSEGESAGEYMPEDIRGSYTFEEVSTLFEIDLPILYQAFGIDPATDGTVIKTKDLEVMYGDLGAEIGNESVQVFVALYKGLPITLDGTDLPAPAADLLLGSGLPLIEEQIAYVQEHRIPLDGSRPEAETITEEPAAAEPAQEAQLPQQSDTGDEPLINGNVTIQQVLDAGITKDQLLEVLGTELPPGNQVLRDFCQQNGLSFSTVKNQLNGLLEQ